MPASSEPQIQILADPAAVADAAAELMIATAAAAIRDRGRFTLALAGGSTPELAYTRLATPENSTHIDWRRTELWFGDERLVPPDDARSNFAMVQRSLLVAVPIPPENIVPIATDQGSAAACAEAYADRLSQRFQLARPGPPPRFDLILLGLGDDGHTASLFPGQPSLNEGNAWTVGCPPGVLPPPVDRVSLTFPVLNAARSVLFLVTGAKKAAIVHKILRESPSISEAPAVGVQPVAGTVTWLLDRAAADNL